MDVRAGDPIFLSPDYRVDMRRSRRVRAEPARQAGSWSSRPRSASCRSCCGTCPRMPCRRPCPDGSVTAAPSCRCRRSVSPWSSAPSFPSRSMCRSRRRRRVCPGCPSRCRRRGRPAASAGPGRPRRGPPSGRGRRAAARAGCTGASRGCRSPGWPGPPWWSQSFSWPGSAGRRWTSSYVSHCCANQNWLCSLGTGPTRPSAGWADSFTVLPSIDSLHLGWVVLPSCPGNSMREPELITSCGVTGAV